MRRWFSDFSDEQKNLLLKDLLVSCADEFVFVTFVHFGNNQQESVGNADTRNSFVFCAHGNVKVVHHRSNLSPCVSCECLDEFFSEGEL